MKQSKVLKFLGGLCVGCGIGVCFGVAMNNLLTGLLLGIGVGLCYAVAFGAFKKD